MSCLVIKITLSSVIGIPLKDENNHEPTVQARQHHSNSGSGVSVSSSSSVGVRHHGNMRMTPLEIGMYVLLAAFCFAIVVFVVSCVVYASKFKPQTSACPDTMPEPIAMSAAGKSIVSGNSAGLMMNRRQPQEPTTNAHDWVWLGRATLERASGMLVPAGINNNPNRAMRITANPTYTPQDQIASSQCFDSPNHIDLPSGAAVPVIDSATYCKDRHVGRQKMPPAENLWKM